MRKIKSYHTVCLKQYAKGIISIEELQKRCAEYEKKYNHYLITQARKTK